MTTITVKVPDSLVFQMGGSVEKTSKESQHLLAVKLFESGRLSSGQAAEMCDMNRVDFLLGLGRSGVPVADLDREELDREVQNA